LLPYGPWDVKLGQEGSIECAIGAVADDATIRASITVVVDQVAEVSPEGAEDKIWRHSSIG